MMNAMIMVNISPVTGYTWAPFKTTAVGSGLW